MAAATRTENPDDVASRVMRRVQVSKMTRALQDRLALANVKIQNGWENLSLDAIEPQVEERLRRKRPASSNNDTISDTASTVSSRLHSSNGLASSPITEPMFSDDLPRSVGNTRHKRIKPAEAQRSFASSGAVTGRRTRGAAARQNTWKKEQSLAQSSPIKQTKHARFASNQTSQLSFISEGSTIADDPPSPEFSEEDDADLPVHSFNINPSTQLTSSPPRTPPPDRRMRKINHVSWSRTPKTGDDGADLLMYLATSPSPANGASHAKSIIQPPTTPPMKSTPLPSSHMTPGTTGNGFLGFGPNTPGTNFCFSDFVNITPSPAQGPWSRTPVAGRTPGASARRKLDFNNLMPPSSSPTMNRSTPRNGLGMELGGELLR
ncbi:hypothetical protein CLAFUW4_12768 [Fulvia fulva]|uniref:Uncharacterized protein n=1 Tax=Passalora fulva TaxID=5499 RepID=A0A9Q8PJS8_PASFU|nr:uncharacterized protein CLAFUR5_12634 [Fulvia fulva]KAK4612146.1 hypothetical protein CLAFUR4_12772 [Fulvia fulva]KAK4612360.1 hypothetical protein CLAFUR0_12778 [Fulvia fulva]UJO23826.1 hypothetical protein CLAFUR5_12634 [Fulvia fulva]WPV21536.1 hypothetical protein CLAFUW4_12768 [Fulvia fulva]WPV36581.1 hypothetical protein CLAFUW7_12775 [Fulvia fulva]